MIERRVGGRRPGQAAQQRRLPDVQLGHRLAEVRAGGGLDAVGAVPEVDLVQVHLEDPVLRVPPLQLEREHGFLHLALEALVRREEEDLGQLLGDGAAALDDAAPAVVLGDRPRDADGVDAPVIVEALVLGGDDRVAQRLGDVGQGHQDAALDVELGDRLVVVVVDLGALDRLQGFERGDRRE